MGKRIERGARWLLKTVYRLEATGWDNVPVAGAAVLVSNHVSYLDAAIIATCSPRQVRFVMDHRIFANKAWCWLFRALRAIPIASARDDAAVKERAFGAIARALAQGEVVCIFPEGRLSATGDLQPFQHGIERVVRETPVPVVPIALGGLWGSVFSRARQSLVASWTHHIRRRIRAACGAPVDPRAVSSTLLEQRVRALAEGR